MTRFFTYHNKVLIPDIGDQGGWHACKLTSDTVLLAGIDDNDGGQLSVILQAGQRNGDGITLGSILTLDDSFVSAERMVVVEYVEDNKALCVYLDESSPGYIRGSVITASGLTLNNATPSTMVTGVFSDGVHQFPQLVNIQTGEFLLIYRTSTPAVLGRRLVVSGTSITVGNALTLLAAGEEFWDVHQITPGKLLFIYDDGTGSNAKARVLSNITSSSVTLGTAVNLASHTEWPIASTSWNGVDSVSFSNDVLTDQRTVLRAMTESGTNLTVHAATYTGYNDASGGQHQNKLTAVIEMNNVGLWATNTTYPAPPGDSTRLFEFDYNTGTKVISLRSYSQILAPSESSRIILNNLSESLATCSWYDGFEGLFYNMFISTYLPSYFWGVWQGGMGITYLSYGAFSPVYLGTHIANQSVFIRSYHPYSTFTDLTGNLIDLTYNIYGAAATYVSTYGATYAAVMYQMTYTNVRAIGFV